MEGDFIWPCVLLSRANTTVPYSGDDAQSATSSPRIRLRIRFHSSNPSGWAEERRQKRSRAGTCLSRRRVCACPRFCRAPQVDLLGSDTHFAAVHGTAPSGRAEGSANWGSDPKNSQTIGSPFFSLGFFGDAKKSKLTAGARPGLYEDPTEQYMPFKGFDPPTSSDQTPQARLTVLYLRFIHAN